MLVASAGEGKVAGHFDRNTFFNQNGAGTNINRFDNKQYALNLFGWLVGAFDPVPGDYDGNGTVEEADRIVWANAYGSTGASPADGNGDGVVDAADYTVWRDNLGRTAPALDLSLPATAAVEAAFASLAPAPIAPATTSAAPAAVVARPAIGLRAELLLIDLTVADEATESATAGEPIEPAEAETERETPAKLGSLSAATV